MPQLQCVWFRDDRVRSPFQPQTGIRVVAHGRIDVYEPQGALQLYVDVAPAERGWGPRDPVRAAQGPARAPRGCSRASGSGPCRRGRRSSPWSPRRPAPRGSDVCHVFARRWPLTRVVLVACQVQGEGAPASIVRAMRRIERLHRAMHTRRDGRTRPRRSRSSRGAAVRSRTSGRSTTSGSCGRSWRIRCRSSAGSGMRST